MKVLNVGGALKRGLLGSMPRHSLEHSIRSVGFVDQGSVSYLVAWRTSPPFMTCFF